MTLVRHWQRLPKIVRFIACYGLGIFWFPLYLLSMICLYLMLAPFMVVAELWEKFK